MLTGVALFLSFIAVFFIAPLWLLLHYRSKRQINQGFNPQDVQELHALRARTEKLQDRIQTLERILDVESPNWRQ